MEGARRGATVRPPAADGLRRPPQLFGAPYFAWVAPPRVFQLLVNFAGSLSNFFRQPGQQK